MVECLRNTTVASKYPFRLLSDLTRNRFVLLAFCLPVLIRSIPEIMAGTYPVGFDTINYYVPWALRYPFTAVALIAEPSGVFLTLSDIRAVTGISPLLEMKLIFPLAYGMMGFSLYTFFTRRMRWIPSRSVLTVLLVLTQLSALRLAWDQLRILIGLSIIFILLASFQRSSTPREGASWALPRAALLSCCVLCNQLTGILAVPLSWRQVRNTKQSRPTNTMWPLPATFLLALELYYFATSPQLLVSERIHWLPIPTQQYNTATDPLFPLAFTGLLLLTFIPFPIALFSYIGRTRNPDLLLLAGISAVGSFTTAMLQTWPSSLYWIWILVLCFVISVYSSNGLIIGSKYLSERITLAYKQKIFAKIVSVTLLLVPLSLGVAYASTNSIVQNSTLNTFIPGGLVYSSVSIPETRGVEVAVAYVNSHAGHSSAILVEERFKGWAELGLRNDLLIWVIPGGASLQTVTEQLDFSSQHFSYIIFQSFTEEPSQIQPVFRFDSVTVYWIG